ncbi:hypothetical protein KFU94_56840 [Chloroflexi bacterium TSY]|nr:hypothetical protein [Chloroflexi bacterium TSY]
MSFSAFETIDEVQTLYNIIDRQVEFIIEQPFALSSEFLTVYKFNAENVHTEASEAARRETIIYPVLAEAFRLHADMLSLFIEKAMPDSGDEKLSGTPDYLIGKRSPLGRAVLSSPLLTVIEAKQNNFNKGWAACLAEMIAMQLINSDSTMPVYGIVTDGPDWDFGRLTSNILERDRHRFHTIDLERLLGAVNYVFEQMVASVR